MSTTDALIVYASTHGHTAKVATHIQDRLRERGACVRTVGLADADTVDAGDFDLVVAGGSVHVGHHQRALGAWLRKQHDALAGRPTVIFSVSLTAADDGSDARETTAGYLAELLADSRLEPALATSFAGALQYREYDVATRVLIRLIARAKHLPTDPSVDVDFTDWDAVTAFADAALELVPVPVAPG